MTLTEPALHSPTRIISPVYLPATGRSHFLHLHHSWFHWYTSFIPSLINHLQGRSDASSCIYSAESNRRLTMRTGCCADVPRRDYHLIKISVRWKTIVQPFVSGLQWNVSGCSSCQQAFTLAEHHFTANCLYHVWCPLSCCLSLYRNHYKCY